MKAKARILTLLSPFMLAGCMNSLEDASVAPRTPLIMAFTSGTSTWNGLCKKLTLSVSGGYPESKTLGLSAETGDLYSSPGCSGTAIDSLTVAAGATSATVYYKNSGTAPSTIRVDHEDGDPAEVTIQVVTPTFDRVLGQASFTAFDNTCTVNAATFCEPMDVEAGGGKLWIVDGANSRVLVYNTLEPESSSSAGFVLGQPGFTSNGFGASATTMNYPNAVTIVGNKLLVADSSNNRVLIWNTLPTTTQAPANVVVGQADMTSDTAATAANRLVYAGGVESDGTRMFISDYGNNRILIWNTIPIADNSSADIVVGQPDFTSGGNGTAANIFSGAYFTNLINGKLFLADYLNHRILIWDSVPENNENADLVLGQANFVSGQVNRGGGATAATLQNPGYTKMDAQGRLFVSDCFNNRILVWNSMPTSMGQAADAVIGQPDFTTVAANRGATGLACPWGFEFVGDDIWIADFDNYRVVRLPLP